MYSELNMDVKNKKNLIFLSLKPIVLKSNGDTTYILNIYCVWKHNCQATFYLIRLLMEQYYGGVKKEEIV